MVQTFNPQAHTNYKTYSILKDNHVDVNLIIKYLKTPNRYKLYNQQPKIKVQTMYKWPKQKGQNYKYRSIKYYTEKIY